MKSKGKALIFSILPGGGHFYLGVYTRGIIFLISSLIFSMSFRNYGYGPFNAFSGLNNLFHNFAILVWVYSAIDAYISADYINRGIVNLEEEMKFSNRNKNLLGIILALVPGLGHLYEEHSERGSKLLVIFVVGAAIGGLFNTGLINDLLIILSVYSVLDLMAIREGKSFGFKLEKSKEFNLIVKIAGIALIAFGISQAFQIASTYIVDFGFNYILSITSVVIKSLILIVIGMVILYKSRK